MAVTAGIIIDTATDVLYIPTGSLVTQNSEVQAKTLVDGKEVDVTVETGISSDTNTVIKSGLTEGQTVITGTASTSKTTTTTKSIFSGMGGGGSFAR